MLADVAEGRPGGCACATAQGAAGCASVQKARGRQPDG